METTFSGPIVVPCCLECLRSTRATRQSEYAWRSCMLRGPIQDVRNMHLCRDYLAPPIAGAITRSMMNTDR